MTLRVFLPGQLRELYGIPPGPIAVPELPAGATLGAVLAALDARWPGLAHRLADAGRLRPYILVFAGNRQLTGLEETLPPGEDVRVIPAVAGGSRGSCQGR